MSSLPQDGLVTDGASPHTPSTFSMNGTGVEMIFAGDKASQSAAIVTRLSTYNSQKVPNAILLASSGFSYDEKSKTVKCFECGCTIDAKNPADPLTLHKRSSPNCSFFSPAARIHGSTAPSEMTSMPNRSSAPTPAPVNKKNTSLQTPKYSQYQEHSARLASYQGWPLEAVKQFPDYLAKCGFFYIGSADRVRCFFCGITLRNWEAEDDPYIEHKNWAPRCTFIQTLPPPNRHSCPSIPVPSAGSQMPASTSERPDGDHRSLPMPQSHHQPAAHQHSHSGVTHSSNSSSSAGSHPSRPAVPSPSLPHAKSGSSDFTSSPTVLAVVEMGFAREVVEEVMRQKIAADSTPFSSALELYVAVENHVNSN